MFSLSFFERQFYRQNISAVFEQPRLNQELLKLLGSKIENFESKYPNFISNLNAREKQNLLNDLFVLNAYDFINEKFFRIISKMARPLDEIHQQATEVGFLMENYAGLRKVYPFLVLLHRKKILKSNYLLSTELKEALEYLQDNYENYYEYQFLLYMLMERQFLDENLIVSALTTSQPYLLCRIFDIFEDVCSKKMAYQFFKQVKSWENETPEFIENQLQLIQAMEFFKKRNHRHLMESGMFQWHNTSVLLKQTEIFQYFHPDKSHFENILSMKNPSLVAYLLIEQAPMIIQNSTNIDNTLEIFFKLVSIYPEKLNMHMLYQALTASLKFKNILGDLNHPVLTNISSRMWDKLTNIAIAHHQDIDEKAQRFIECIEQGKRFMNYEINTFSLRHSPVSVVEPISPKWISSELEDLSSLKRSWPI